MDPGEKNRNHPELRRGEVFDGNVKPGSKDIYYWALERRPRKLKENERLGQQAYDIYDNPVGYLRPLFLKKSRGSKRLGR